MVGNKILRVLKWAISITDTGPLHIKLINVCVTFAKVETNDNITHPLEKKLQDFDTHNSDKILVGWLFYA